MPTAVLVINQFLTLATTATTTFGAETANVIVVRDDVDRITGAALDAEADRVVGVLLGAAA